MTFPDQIKDLVEWAEQPAPAFVGDTHTLRFVADPNGIAGPDVWFFIGQLFYRPKGAPGGSPRFARLEGSGDLFRAISNFPQSDQQIVELFNTYGINLKLVIELSDTGLVAMDYHQILLGVPTVKSVETGIASIINAQPGPAFLHLNEGQWVIRLETATAADWAPLD